MVVKLLFRISADTVEENETRKINSFSVKTHARLSDMMKTTQLAGNFVKVLNKLRLSWTVCCDILTPA